MKRYLKNRSVQKAAHPVVVLVCQLQPECLEQSMKTVPVKNRRPRAAMYLAGLTDSMIAERCNPPVTPLYVNIVVNGFRKGYRIREVIARECGKTVKELWPDDDDDPELPAAA